MTAHDPKTVEQFRRSSFVQKFTLTGTGTTYVSLKPGYHSTIMINKNGSTGTLKITNDFTQVDGVPGLVDNEEFGEEQSSGTNDYHKGHTAGFTGAEIVISAFSSNIEVRVTQFLLGD